MNNKDFKVITINGFTGLICFAVLLSTLCCLFILLPIWTIREVWNYAVAYYLGGPEIWYFHSFLLWLAGVLALHLIIKRYVSISFHNSEFEDEDEINDFINRTEKTPSDEKKKDFKDYFR